MAEDDQTDRPEADSDEPSPIIREKDEQDEEGDEGQRASEGLSQYDSERDPGGAVRVAKVQDDVSAEAGAASEEDEGEESSGPPVEVTVRGEGTTEPEASDDGADEPEAVAAEELDEQSVEEAEPELEEGAEQPAGAEEAADAGTSEPGGEAPERPEAIETPDAPDPDEIFEGAESGEATTEQFEQLLEGEEAVPGDATYEPGDLVEGEVVSISEFYVFVELDQQTDGVAQRREFEDDEGKLPFEEGDTAEFYVIDVSEENVTLGRQLEGSDQSLEAIQEAHENGVPVEGTITGTNKGGFEVEVHGVDAFCPISEIELGYTEEKEHHVGETYRFKVDEVRDGGDSVVLSRAELLREERAEQKRQTLSEIEEGDQVEGVVTRTTNFGAFVDLGGVEGLIHESELSHHHFGQAQDVVEEGEVVDVEV
ncbi:MAG: S1 RNA-binding domain-containing protein, partial [Bradymonadaceae bacterium]